MGEKISSQSRMRSEAYQIRPRNFPFSSIRALVPSSMHYTKRMKSLT